MLGFDTIEPAAALWLCLAASAWCVVYGIRNWNESGRKQVSRDGEE
ncbi:symporter small accessory protein [Salidesulfovibrio brasiliensis]|nr:symporter small accessory protein [Salidesulfovibrio brasiliensis]